MSNLICSEKLIKIAESRPRAVQLSISDIDKEKSDVIPFRVTSDFSTLSNTARHLKGCREESWSFSWRCMGCNRKVTTIGHCFIRYCSYCLGSKQGRATTRLNEPMAGFPSFVTHLILTIPTAAYSKDSKKFIENSKRKLFQNLRRHGMRFQAVSIVDYGNPKGEDKLETNLHIHNALDVPYSFYLSPSFLQKQWAKATGIDNAVVRVVKSKKSAVIRYFAKRIAGDFGHGKNPILFENLMTVEQYDGLVKGSRCMTLSFPRGSSYSSKQSAKVSQLGSMKCEFCGDDMVLEAGMFKNMIIFGEFG